MTASPPASADRWLLLLAVVPGKPDYLRVKVGRRLARLGAVAVKNGVHALPASDSTLEDLEWVLREVISGGGEGSIVEARFVSGLSDAAVEELFRADRDAQCAPLIEEARGLLEAEAQPPEAELDRLRRRLGEIGAVDFFGSARRAELEGLVGALGQRLRPAKTPDTGGLMETRGRTWVTRRGVKVDRMASAWLIRRYIDAEARFKFVDAKGYTPEPGELRFDMFDAEYTHEGEDCTFEVLIRRFELQVSGLRALAEIVHDIDLKDGRYGRPETAGVAAMVEAVVATQADDDARIARASATFDDLVALFAGRGV